MQSLPAPEVTRGARGAIARRWSNAALQCEVALARTQSELDRCQREVALHRLTGREPGAIQLQRISVLQLRCDALARELTHHRLAIAGLRAS